MLCNLPCSFVNTVEGSEFRIPPPSSFSPWESDITRPRPFQVQSSLISCMLRHPNRAEAAGPPASESAGFPEERQWHPVSRRCARQWSFCIPKELRILRTWLPVSHACPTAAVPDQRSGTLCLKCELSLPPLSPFEDSLGADSLTPRVLRVGGCGGLRESIMRVAWQEASERLLAICISYLQVGWEAFMVNTFSSIASAVCILGSLMLKVS